MRKAVFSIILVFSLLLFSFGVYAEPIWSNPTPNIPQNYNPSYSTFNITWSNNTVNTNITQVNISLNYTGSPTNYSMNLISGDALTGNYGFQEILGAGNYEWRSCAVDNETKENCTDYYYFTIQPADPLSKMHVTINGADSNQILVYPYLSNITAWNDVGDINCTYGFYRNNIQFPSFNETNLFGVGTYNYIYNVTGCANYTSSSLTRTLTISQGMLPIRLYLNNIEGNRTNGDSYSLYSIADFKAFLNIINETVYLNSTFPSFVTQSNKSSTTQNITFNTTNLTSPGLYAITAYWNGSQNYSSSSKTYYFGVTPYFTTTSVSIPSGSIYNSSGNNYNFSIKWIGNIKNVAFESNFFNGYQNFTNVINDTGGNYWINFTYLPTGSFTYRWHATDVNNNNFSGQWDYIVAQIPVNLTVGCSDSDWSTTAGAAVSFSCNANNSVRMRMTIGSININSSGAVTSFSSGTLTSLTANTYVYCSLLDTNYSIANSGDDGHWLTIASTSSTPTPTPTPTPTTTSSNSFIIKDLVSTLTMNAGETKSTPFTLSNTLNAGSLVNVTVSVTGLDSSWYSISKTKLSYVYRNRLENLTITFKIPSSAEVKDYNVTIAATGNIQISNATRTATKTMKLTVTSSQPAATPPITQPENNETLPSVATEQENNTQNMTSNQTLVGPTGLAATFEYLKNNLVIIIAIAACLLIFFFRNNITETMTIGKVPQRTHKQLKIPSLKNYKLIVGLKKGKDEPEMPERLEPKPEVRRPQVLEREIKRDIKELQQIIDSEKKIDRKKKNIKMENN